MLTPAASLQGQQPPMATISNSEQPDQTLKKLGDSPANLIKSTKVLMGIKHDSERGMWGRDEIWQP